MKKFPTGSRVSQRAGECFESRWSAYSRSVLPAAVAGAAAMGATATVSAQTITPITSGTLTVSLTQSLGAPAGGYQHTAKTGQFFGIIGSGSHWGVQLRVEQHNQFSVDLAAGRISARVAAHSTERESGPRLLGLNSSSLINFHQGVHIGTGSGNRGRALQTASFHGVAGNKTAGQFTGGHTGYLGFKEQHSGHTYFGWLRLNIGVDGNGRADSVSLVSTNGIIGAYAVAGAFGGQNIAAGQVTAIPEPATVATGLALFALGAGGVREFRKRRAA